MKVTNLYQGFVIVYSTKKTNETFNVTVNSAQSFYELTNLTGFSYYEIRLAIYTLVGLGKWSEPITVLTAEDGLYLACFFPSYNQSCLSYGLFITVCGFFLTLKFNSLFPAVVILVCFKFSSVGMEITRQCCLNII